MNWISLKPEGIPSHIWNKEVLHVGCYFVKCLFNFVTVSSYDIL